ncbi:FG-GAP-like repeat-containing protein [Tenacibaculum sp. Mcav3-52]|uniref:FG-GAP-like repeat-containing protein n=1 Tax=Tenacibaculum sp. Mcav3-52 TaxID=2917762 RepID=UPI001EF3D405|nr:FG-GAP-like repeat-containing protein [Tenacibaculum sp. Mcav3-52]MCG7501719.1 FG-GAP-like repeat-containing protein [Tenacibaculum sp. Mcav3-52]
MKRNLYTCVLFLLFVGIQFSNAQDPNVVGGNSSVKIKYKKIKLKTEKTFNEARNSSNVAARTPVEPCLVDPNTGECVDPGPIDPVTTTEAGSTAGSLSVSLTGGASYSIPIMIPPSIKNVAPNIAISYSSQGANGLAGWGWNISGLSTISRIPATKYYDNKHDGIDYNDDRFSIDGQRLILKSGTYGANGSIYQTENYSNIKVVAHGTSPYGVSYGPEYFIVYYPNGTRTWYGKSGNSRSRLEWAIFRSRDPQGNYIDYNYQSDNGLLSIKTINYGGRVGGTSPMNQINFTYTTRTRSESVYVGGNHFKRTNLLKNIQVTSSGNQYRKYELNHSLTSLGYQRLTSVKEYNSENKGLNPITFNYENTSNTLDIYSSKLYSTTSVDIKKSKMVGGDFDGDLKSDFLIFDPTKKDKLYVYQDVFKNSSYNLAYEIATGKFEDVFSNTILSHNNKILTQQAITTVSETASSTSTNSSIRFRTFAMAAYGPVHQYDKVWNTNKYRSDSYCGSTHYYTIPKKYVTGDFNGDGLTDVIAIDKPYTSRTCYQKRDCGGGLDEPIPLKTSEEKEKIENSNVEEARLPIEECCECDTYTQNKYNAKVHFIDLKRDVNSNFAKVSGYLRKGVSLNDLIIPGDYNGDGKVDIIHVSDGKIYVYTLNDNNNLELLYEESDPIINTDYSILPGDYNGDGKTDFAIPTKDKTSTWKFFISKGENGFYKYEKDVVYYFKTYVGEVKTIVNGWLIINPLYIGKYYANDFNNDGKSDIMQHYTISPYNSNIIKQVPVPGKPQKSYLHYYENSGNENFKKILTKELDEDFYSKDDVSLYLDIDGVDDKSEYSYIYGNTLYAYKYLKDHRKDVLLKSATNNGVKTTVEYERLGMPENNYGPIIYTESYNQIYPYINVNKSPSFQLVKKLIEEGAGVKRYQDFRYEGAVSNVDIGFQGFIKTKRSNWYGNGVSTLWTISKYDPLKKGALTEQWVSTSYNEGSNYISKTSNTYSSNLANNKVFTITPTKIVQHDALTGVTTTKTLTYNSYKNPLTEYTTYNGGSKNITYAYSNNSSVNNEYYHVGRLVKKVKTNTIGGNAFTTEEEYVYSNNLLTQQKVKGNSTSWNTESFTYDAYGNVTEKTLTPSGDVVARKEEFKYDETKRFLTESTDIERQVTKFTYDVFGNPLTTTNPYNQITTFTYDGWNRLISEKNYLGKITTFSYTKLSGGGLKKTTNYPQGADEIEEYNALGWVTKRGRLGLNNKWTYKSVQYDVVGRVIKESEPYFSFPSQWNTTSYDDYGRAIARTSFNGLVANISYSGLRTTVDDGAKTVKTTKDGSGNIVKMEDPGGTITYSYYGNGVMKSANYGSHVVSTEIDGWGRKTKLTDPSAGVYTYEYNSIGEVLKETTPKGYTKYDYDEYGKIITKDIKGDETNISLKYEYNADNLLEYIRGKNVRTNEDYLYTYLYDSQKRPYKTKEQNGKAYFEHQVIRDSYGRVNVETYISKNLGNSISSTVKVKNVYDANSGVLTEIQDYNANTILWKIKEVNERGLAKEVLLGNGMIKKRTYDQYGFLTKILDQTSDASKKALHLDYSFNTVRGNLNTRKNNNLGWNENFSYDNLDRLTNISGSVSRAQEYDGRGRITSNSVLGTYNYGSTTSYRLQEVDLNTQGDLYYQNHPLQKIKYNAYKKPISISVKDKAKVDFEYGLLQNRSHAYYGGNEDNKLHRRYQKHYSAITPVEIEVDKQGNTKIITYIGGDAYSAPLMHVKQTASGSANGYHYLHRDYLSSVLAITKSDGTVQEQRQFGAWGEVDKFKSLNSEIDYEHDTTLINRGYTGHEHFMGVALIHMNGRMYDAKLGRFLSPDNYMQKPFSTQSFNRFGYVWNNPLKFTDPSGEIFWMVVIASAVFGGVVGASQAVSQGKPWYQGFLKGAFVGAVGGALGQIGGGGFLSNVLMGAVQGAAVGVLNSVVWGNNIWNGLKSGALWGAAFATVTSGIEATQNAIKGHGFRTNEGVLKKYIKTGKYKSAMNYVQDTYKLEGPNYYYDSELEHLGVTNTDGSIGIGIDAFESSDILKSTMAHEYGHYINDIAVHNGEKVLKIYGRAEWNNYDGTSGYKEAIKRSGEMNIGIKTLKRLKYFESNPEWVNIWEYGNTVMLNEAPYNPVWYAKGVLKNKWWYTLPKRF